MGSLIDYYSILSAEELYYQELSSKGEASSQALRLPASVEDAARRDERIMLPSSAYLDSSHDIFISKHPCFMPPYLHTHDFCEMTFMLKGNAREQIEGEEIALEKDSVLIITPGYYHKVSVFDSDTIALNVICSTALLFSLASDLRAEELTKGYTIFRRLTGEAEGYLEKIFREQCSSTEGSRTIQNACFTLLLSELVRKGERSVHFERQGDSGWLYKVLAYIDENFRSVTLNEVSEVFRLSESYLSKTIHEKTGSSFADYIRSHKLRETKRLLISSDMTMNEIAYSLSLTQEHLTRIFKKDTGISPIQYRKRYSR